MLPSVSENYYFVCIAFAGTPAVNLSIQKNSFDLNTISNSIAKRATNHLYQLSKTNINYLSTMLKKIHTLFRRLSTVIILEDERFAQLVIKANKLVSENDIEREHHLF